MSRSDSQELLLSLLPDDLSRAASFLHSLSFPDASGPERLGHSFAGGVREYLFDSPHVEIRTVRRPQREPAGCARHGSLARLRFLRSLRHPRSLAAALLAPVHPRAPRSLAAPHA